MSEENYGIDDDFLKEVQDATKGAILEKQELGSKDEKEELIIAYKKHVAEQLKIENPRERVLFTDDYGATVCLIRTPEKIYKKNAAGKFVTRKNKEGKSVRIVENMPKITNNKAYRLWGFNLVLFGKNNKNTMFGETMKSLIGHSQKALVRGAMTKKYKYGKENSMFESAFVSYMAKVYAKTKPDRDEVISLDDIDFSDYFDDFTFNIWETLILWGGAE